MFFFYEFFEKFILDSRRDTLISLGIINTLVSLLILDNEKDVKVHALWVLGNLSCSEKAQELICQSGILPFLITSFSSNEDDLVYRGILCFANLLLSGLLKKKYHWYFFSNLF